MPLRTHYERSSIQVSHEDQLRLLLGRDDLAELPLRLPQFGLSLRADLAEGFDALADLIGIGTFRLEKID